MKREAYTLGMISTAIVFVVFTVITYKIIGFWCVVVGPFITLMACRPARANGSWLWQRSKS